MGRGFLILCWLSHFGNLAIISRDRYLAVSKPWWYRCHVTRSRVAKQTTVVWIFSLLMGVLVWASYKLQALVALFYVICFLAIMCSYVGIFISNKRQRQTIHQHGGQMLTTLRREKKLANTVGLILIVLCCTFIPALSIPLILAILGYSTADFLPFRPFYALFITLNGLLNPLLNYGRNKDVRRAVRRLITCPAQHLGRVHTLSNIESNARKHNIASFTVQSEAK